ncbi:MAG: glycosyltransferase [Nanoarchaeota archaeon]
MKIKVFGYRGPHNNTNDIENELKKSGHDIITNEQPDLIVDLNGPFTESQLFYNKCLIKPIRLYILLDIDPQKNTSWYDQTKLDLESCEIACVISQTVKNQIKKILKIDKKLNILHHPIKNVSNLKFVKGFMFLYSGRIYSKNKRFDLVLQTLDCLGYDRETLVVAGTERPPLNCVFVESPDDNILNQVFNAADILLSPSEFEGQNCNMIQAVITRTFPILNNQCEVVREFGLEKFSSDPTPEKMAKKIHEIKSHTKYYLDIMNELRPVFQKQFSVETIVKNMLELYNNYRKNN